MVARPRTPGEPLDYVLKTRLTKRELDDVDEVLEISASPTRAAFAREAIAHRVQLVRDQVHHGGSSGEGKK
jgi:hypothetical protein